MTEEETEEVSEVEMVIVETEDSAEIDHHLEIDHDLGISHDSEVSQDLDQNLDLKSLEIVKDTMTHEKCSKQNAQDVETSHESPSDLTVISQYSVITALPCRKKLGLETLHQSHDLKNHLMHLKPMSEPSSALMPSLRR